jgi:hypothetical protein
MKENSMSNQSITGSAASAAQIAELRDLCAHTGTDYLHPATAADARNSLTDLKALNVRQENARARFLELAVDAGLPTPDVVVHQREQLRFLWTDRKVMVVLDLDDLTAPTTVTARSRAR